MPRQMPLRQYTNQAQSGTITKGGMRKDPIENVIDRVMLLGQRLVAAESAIKNQATEIVGLKETIKKLEGQIEDYTAPSIVKEAKAPKPRPARRRKPSTALQEEVAKLTETTES